MDATDSRYIAADDTLAVEATTAVQQGDLDALDRLLAAHPELATARLGEPGCSRTLLHAATDWPGHFPRGPEVVARLVAAGADVDARFDGGHTETPLHWAASSDDVAALDALLDHGADIEADGAVLGGGSPLADATGFGQWNVARRLVERGAWTRLKDAAALGLLDRMHELLASVPPPDRDQLTQALWSACNGGQRATAELLLDRGADIDWVGWDDLTPLDLARRPDNPDPTLAPWLASRGAHHAPDLDPP
ncbi:MAG TPA: ankyrin repeat domain-containing protein [Acidimicrobiales bacterium]|nr:ankyrin repeat domain-containing protein [Acidimicrobiales bacterium]